MWRLLAQWCCPAQTFPGRLTQGDDCMILVDWAHLHYDNPSPNVWVRRR